MTQPRFRPPRMLQGKPGQRSPCFFPPPVRFSRMFLVLPLLKSLYHSPQSPRKHIPDHVRVCVLHKYAQGAWRHMLPFSYSHPNHQGNGRGFPHHCCDRLPFLPDNLPCVCLHRKPRVYSQYVVLTCAVRKSLSFASTACRALRCFLRTIRS